MSKRRRSPRKQSANQSKNVSKALHVLGKAVPYWQLIVAVLALLFAVGSYIYTRYQNKKESTANMVIQVVVQPDIQQDNIWHGTLMVINSGPAEAKPFIVHLSLGNPMQYSHLSPPTVSCPPIVESGVEYAGGGQTYQISANSLPPNSSCDILVSFKTSEQVKEKTSELWKTNGFSTEFYGKFFKSIEITGENTTQTFMSVAFRDPQTKWDLP